MARFVKLLKKIVMSSKAVLKEIENINKVPKVVKGCV
jgi:hypothetical protein